jgi:hypothetical protein
MSNYKTWNKYPFSANGVEFISYINPAGSIAKKLSLIPLDVFNAMNQGAVEEFLGDPSLMSRNEILAELEIVNAGYHEAYIDLV